LRLFGRIFNTNSKEVYKYAPHAYIPGGLNPRRNGMEAAMRNWKRGMVTGALGIALSTPALAGGVSQHFSNALANSLEAIAQGTVAGLKLVSGAIAVPLMISGEIGRVSGEAGEELWQEANTPIGTPLVITDAVITAGPTPAQAMQSSGQEQPR
jgi:hypothetical protein